MALPFSVDMLKFVGRLFWDGYAAFLNQSTPSTPASGQIHLYAKNNQPNYQNSDGVEGPLLTHAQILARGLLKG